MRLAEDIFFTVVWLLVGIIIGVALFITIADKMLIHSGGNFPDPLDYGMAQ